jgi:hypothetical protein
MILPDSSAWIAFFHPQRNEVADRLDRLIDLDADICLCGPVLSEVLRGLTGPAELRRVKSIFEEYDYLDADRNTHERAAEIFRQCRAGGFTIRSIIDCIIAATALKHGAEILHQDRDYTTIARFIPLRIH